VNYRYCCPFQSWKLYRYFKELEGLPSQGKGYVGILRRVQFWTVTRILKPITLIVVTSEEVAVINTVLFKAENTFRMEN
jgi:hypothetical protein